MNCIQVMVDEHKYIVRMLAVTRKYCYKILKGEVVEYKDFFKIIDFVRNFADKHHHGKEEKMLFNRMVEEQGPAAEKLVRHGMLVEHDWGRLYMADLEIAVNKVIEGDDEAKLDVIANAVSYTHLLTRHIQKEDDVVYKFAERGLSSSTIEKINQECEEFEVASEKEEIQKKYISLLEELEKNV